MWSKRAARKREGCQKGRQHALSSRLAVPGSFLEPKAQIRVLHLHGSPPTSFRSCFYFLPAPVSYFLVPSLRPTLSFPDVASPSLPRQSSLRWLGPETLGRCCWRLRQDITSHRCAGASGQPPGATPSPTLPTPQPAPELALLPPLSPPARPCHPDNDKRLST